jgi:hypothetical protein
VEHITVTGHTDFQRISRRLQSRYPDNHALSYGRAATIGAYLADGLNLKADQVTYEGKGPDEPVASNRTDEGRAKNRRVELNITPAKQLVAVRALVSGPPSGMKAVATMGLRPGEVWLPEKGAAAMKDNKNMPVYNAAWFETAEPGTPGFGRLTTIIRHGARRSRSSMTRRDAAAPPVAPRWMGSTDGTGKRATNRRGHIWRGIHLADGDNRFELVVLDPSGAEVSRISVTHYSGRPAGRSGARSRGSSPTAGTRRSSRSVLTGTAIRAPGRPVNSALTRPIAAAA